jgi:hypothetical protein
MSYNQDLTKINTQRNAKIIKLKKKVLFNKDLLNHIISYSGAFYTEICQICNKPLYYSVFLIDFDDEIIFYYNLEQCRTKKFCSEKCLEEYNETYSNEKCISIISITTLSFVITFFIIIFIENS